MIKNGLSAVHTNVAAVRQMIRTRISPLSLPQLLENKVMTMGKYLKIVEKARRKSRFANEHVGRNVVSSGNEVGVEEARSPSIPPIYSVTKTTEATKAGRQGVVSETTPCGSSDENRACGGHSRLRWSHGWGGSKRDQPSRLERCQERRTLPRRRDHARERRRVDCLRYPPSAGRTLRGLETARAGSGGSTHSSAGLRV